MLGNGNIGQVYSFTYPGSIISKDNGSSEDVKSKIGKVQGVFFAVEKSLEESKDKIAYKD